MSTLLISGAGYTLDPLPDGRWTVTSPAGQRYDVDPAVGTCTCPDGRARGHRRVCKHSKAVWELMRLVPVLKDLAAPRSLAPATTSS